MQSTPLEHSTTSGTNRRSTRRSSRMFRASARRRRVSPALRGIAPNCVISTAYGGSNNALGSRPNVYRAVSIPWRRQ